MKVSPAWDRLGMLSSCQHRATGLDQLRDKVSTAMALELSTLPPYLTALYSIKDTASDAYRLILSVAMEEMLHLNIACNLLIAIGGRPSFTDIAPSYPCYLPNADHEKTPFVSLGALSRSRLANIFMRIEAPAPYLSPAEGCQFDTIGQFYKSIEEDLIALCASLGEQQVFQSQEDLEQRHSFYIGKFGGKPKTIYSLDGALAAIRQIVEQGEGSQTLEYTIVPVEPYAVKNHYGKRMDGTFGPILGTPYELSHYYKFQQLANNSRLPDTYPIVGDVSHAQYQGDAEQLSIALNHAYSLMLEMLSYCFYRNNEGRELFFSAVLGLMHEDLNELSQLLMKTPISADLDSRVGPNAAPKFIYQPSTITGYIEQLEICVASMPSQTVLHSLLSKARSYLPPVTSFLESVETEQA